MNPLLNNLRSFGLTLGVAAFLAAGAAQSSTGTTRLLSTFGRVSITPVTAFADDNGNGASKPPSTGNSGVAIASADDNGNSTPKPPSTGSIGASKNNADDNGNARSMPAIAHHGTSAPRSVVG